MPNRFLLTSGLTRDGFQDLLGQGFSAPPGLHCALSDPEGTEGQRAGFNGLRCRHRGSLKSEDLVSHSPFKKSTKLSLRIIFYSFGGTKCSSTL